MKSKEYTAEELGRTYWLCIFGINQHLTICKQSIYQCQCARENLSPENSNFEVDKFADVLKQMKFHALALDADLDTLTRGWVLLELYTANFECELPTTYCGTVSKEVMERPVITSIEDAKCSVEADKDFIMSEVIKGKGVEAFDKYTSENILLEIAVLRTFQYFEDGNTEEVILINELNLQPRISERIFLKGFNETTLLMLAAAYGYLQLVKKLVSIPSVIASLNSATSTLGFSVLHYAAICFDSSNQHEIVDLLLRAKCDPNLTNILNTTPLEEFVLNGAVDSSTSAFQLLLNSTRIGHSIIKSLFTTADCYSDLVNQDLVEVRSQRRCISSGCILV